MGLDSTGNNYNKPRFLCLVHFQSRSGGVMVSRVAKVLCVMVICGVALGEEPIYPNDEVIPVVTGIEHPLPLLVEPLQKATDAIFGNESDHEMFLSDWWPISLSNSSVLNLTA